MIDVDGSTRQTVFASCFVRSHTHTRVINVNQRETYSNSEIILANFKQVRACFKLPPHFLIFKYLKCPLYVLITVHDVFF